MYLFTSFLLEVKTKIEKSKSWSDNFKMKVGSKDFISCHIKDKNVFLSLWQPVFLSKYITNLIVFI